MNVKKVILYAFISSACMQICLGGESATDDPPDDKVEMSDEFLEELMDDQGFVSAVYWAKSDGDDGDDELAVKYCVSTVDGEVSAEDGDWCDVSKDYTFAKDKGQPGRVWESKDYEYNENVQELDPEKFARQPVAEEVGVKGLLCVAHTEDGKFEGVVELGLKKAKPEEEVEEAIEAVKKLIQN